MGPNDILTKGMVATTAIPLYHVVTQVPTGQFDAPECAIADTAGESWVGVSQEEVEADEVDLGRVIAIRMEGISRCVADGPVAVDDPVAVTATGTVTPAAPAAGVTVDIVGTALSPATQAGEWINVQLTPGRQVTG